MYVLQNAALIQHAKKLAAATNVLIFLDPWRAGKSVASLSSETVPQASAYKITKVFQGFFSMTKLTLENLF